jgi:hypothetical protein
MMVDILRNKKNKKEELLSNFMLNNSSDDKSDKNQVVINSKSDETWIETRSKTCICGIMVVFIISFMSHNGQDAKKFYRNDNWFSCHVTTGDLPLEN